MNHIQRFLLGIAMVCSNISIAQTVEMADTFRQDGKIYVVVAVLSIILIGIFTYLFKIEKDLKKVERNNQTKEN